MTLYLDTSALVKLYVLEHDSQIVREAVDAAEQTAIAVVGYAEARAALARRHREGALTDEGHQEAIEALERDWQALTRLEVTDGMARLAGALAQQYALRGFDAVHLAAALMLQREQEDVLFLGFDDRLTAAASLVMSVFKG